MNTGGSAFTTPVSGDAGQGSQVLGPAGTVLTSLEFFEQSDRPCGIVAGFASWSLDGDQRAEGEDFRTRRFGCAGNSPQRVGARTGEAISGIRICQRRQNDRLKGARVRTGHLVPDGLEPASEPNFERPNCNDWQSWALCTQGQVATGIVVHTAEAGITGIALKCSDVTWEAVPPSREIGGLRGGSPVLTTSASTPGTGISGLSATERVLSAPPNMALRSLTFGERNDHPCYLEARFETYDPNPSGTVVRFDECNGRHASERSVGIPSTIGAIQFASSIGVCQRRQNDRLKGVSLLGSRVDGSGVTADPAINASEERPNCNNWNRLAHCDRGSLVTGVRVHFRPSENNPAEIVGLGPMCSTADYH
jgi:hypothetical protein